MDSKISQLVEVTTITNNDVLPIVNNSETKKVTVETIRNMSVGGDLQGTLPNPVVNQLQGKAVQGGTPADKNLFVYDSVLNMWKHNTAEFSLGFTPENVANKQTDLVASATKYPTVNAVNSGLATKQNTIVNSDSITQGTTNLFLTGAERTKLTNTTNVNSGDETNASILSKLGFNPVKIVVKDATQGSIITGTTAETLIGTYTIPANTFSANDIMKILSFVIEKTGTAGTCTMRVKVGTTATFGNATLIATYNLSGSNIFANLNRYANTLRGGNLRVLNPNASNLSDLINTTGLVSSIVFNPAIENFIFTSLQLSVATDSVFQSNFNVTN